MTGKINEKFQVHRQEWTKLGTRRILKYVSNIYLPDKFGIFGIINGKVKLKIFIDRTRKTLEIYQEIGYRKRLEFIAQMAAAVNLK